MVSRLVMATDGVVRKKRRMTNAVKSINEKEIEREGWREKQFQIFF